MGGQFTEVYTHFFQLFYLFKWQLVQFFMCNLCSQPDYGARPDSRPSSKLLCQIT